MVSLESGADIPRRRWFNPRGTRIVRPWSEATDSCTESSWGRTWLLAGVPTGSPFIHRSPATKLYDRKGGLLKVCELRRIGLTQHQVDNALSLFRP